MKYTFLLPILAAGLVLSACNKQTKSSTAATTSPDYPSSTAATSTPAPATTASDTSTAMNRAATDVSNAANSAGTALSNAGSAVVNSARMTEWKLSASDIQADLDAKRDIVRTKDIAGAQPTGTMDRKTLKTAVESKLKADSEVTDLKLDVNAKKDGEVELEGKAHSAEQVGKAIALALDTDGVSKVTSKIRLDREARTNR